MDPTPLQQAVSGWLAHGPLSVEELADRAVQAGLVSAEGDDEGFEAFDAIEALLERYDDYWTVYSDTDHELVVLASTFVDTGTTFTHRITEEELQDGAVDLAPDLSVLDWGCHDGLFLDGGGGTAVTVLGPASRRLSGPVGWIEGLNPGDLLRFTRTDGVLSVEVVAEDHLDDGASEIEALRAAAARWIGGGRGEEEVPVVMEAMARNPSLFRRPVPPVGELLVAAGLERRGHEWGWADEAWQTYQERSHRHDQVIRSVYGFDHCCDRAFDRVQEAYLEHVRGGEIDCRALAEHLGHGSVAAAFVHAHATTAQALVRFATAAGDSVKGRHVAPALTLLGLALLRTGDAEAAFRVLDDSVRADPDLPAAAGALALLELDRGNLSRAYTLGLRGGVAPGLIQWIESERARQAALRPSAGRNDPCPCGSGRKFKKCCVTGGPLPLAQRVPLVLQRMAHHATGPEGYDTRFGLAISAAAGHEDVSDAIRRFVDDPFLVDVALHEGGLGEAYADQRASLLAEDEVDLIEVVLEEPRRLWEITAVTPGESLTLRDTGSGDELTVIERSGSEGRQPGELMLARATTVQGEPMLFGVPLLVPLRERERVLRMLDARVDGDGLAAWFGSLFLPPRMANREGDELVLRRTVCEITGDPDSVIAVLDETYEPQGDAHVWHETVMVDDHDRVVRGVLRLDGLLLTVESNSERRQERLLATLDELFDYEIVDDGEIDDLGLDDANPDQFDPLGLDDMSGEMRALVEQNMAEYEQRWVDESVPALDGLTPRQALDDPTRREDLFALLREMRSHQLPPGAMGMSVERVERLLGIEGS